MADELTPGYRIDPTTGAWLTLPWPEDVADLPPSLGPQVILWCESKLVHHLTGQPWRFTIGQKRFIHLWYAVRPDGRWLYRSGVKRGAKGTGKDPLAAAMCLAELCGPTRLAGWQGTRPVGEAHRLALVQVAANSEAQAQDVLRVANAMVPKSTAREFGFDKGIKRTLLSGGSKIEILTSSERSSEGDPATAIILNESHHMTESNNGKAVAEVARRNVGKSPGGLARLLELTNAHQQGGASVAEDSFEAWQSQVAGRSPRQDILYDSREAPPDTDLYDDVSRAAGIAAAYSDAPWSDLERIGDEILDTRTSVADSIRFYLNGLAAAEDAWVDPQRFDSMARPDIVVPDGEQIAMFLDCSKSSDATGLVAARISDGHVITLGMWQRPHGERGKGWLAPRHSVDAAVRQAMGQYQVVWFGVDPSPARDDETEALYWAPSIDAWHRDFAKKLTVWATPGANGNSVLFDMRTSMRGGSDRNRAFTEAAEMVQQRIDEDNPVEPLTHDGDPALRMHVHNAKRRANQWGFSLGKVNRDSKNLVDLAVCMVGAQLGRRVALNSGKLRKRSSSRKVVVL